ncbi:MAG: phosphatidate cytidylyltransferase [Bacteroidales bacterium]|nr:phosphatidate cytidylyltransferase [Bacteroidales bacterium]
MSNLLKRSITGSIFVAVSLALILINQWTLLAFLLIADVWLKVEFYRIVKNDESSPLSFAGFVAGIASISVLFAVVVYNADARFLWVCLVPILLIFVEELFKNEKNPLRNVAFTVLSLVYITLPLMTAMMIVFGKYGAVATFNPGILVGVLVLIWIFDSMAYVVGVPLGKHRLYERVSPKKSWEGTIGGTVFTIAAGFFMHNFFDGISSTDWVVISALVVVFGTIGDLIESQFKRSINVKDSGETLPGHGGLLDRLDSFIFTLPWVFIYLVLKDLLS